MLPATCSVKCPNGRRVSRAWPPCTERVRHCCRVPCLSVAPLLVQQALPHVVLASDPLRALFLSLLAPLRARAASAMTGPGELPWPPCAALSLSPPPQAKLCHYVCACRPEPFTPLPLGRRGAPQCSRRGKAATVRPSLHGQRVTGYRRPRCGCSRVRLAAAQPQHCPSVAANALSNRPKSATSRPAGLLCSLLRPGTSRQNLMKARGVTAKI